MLLHLDHCHPFAVVAVTLGSLEMRVEGKVIDVVLAVPGREADHDLRCRAAPQDCERDLALVGRHHFDPPVAGRTTAVL